MTPSISGGGVKEDEVLNHLSCLAVPIFRFAEPVSPYGNLVRGIIVWDLKFAVGVRENIRRKCEDIFILVISLNSCYRHHSDTVSVKEFAAIVN